MSYFTTEERKAKIAYHGDYFTFKSCADLSMGVTITMDDYYSNKDFMLYVPKLISDTARFTTHWMVNFKPKLNGFSGMDTVKFNLETKS